MIRTGKTPVLSAEEASTLLASINVADVVGLRDRALIGVLVFSFARVSAAVHMTVGDYYTQGKRYFFRLHEKGGRYHVVPADHTAQGYVDEYIERAGITGDTDGPLFRASNRSRRHDLLTRAPLSRHAALKVIKRRACACGLPDEIGNHSFRGTGITAYLRNGGTLETAARIAGHASMRTPQPL